MNPEMEIGTDKKALRINLEASKYGTFAEIGAGQEVARRFFRVIPPTHSPNCRLEIVHGSEWCRQKWRRSSRTVNFSVTAHLLLPKTVNTIPGFT